MARLHEEVTDLLDVAGGHPAELDAELPRHFLGRGNLAVHAGMDGVAHEHDLPGVWNSCPKQIQSLCVHLDRHEADARQFLAWTRHAAREFGGDRVTAEAIHHRDIGDPSDAEDCSALGDDHVGLEADNLVNDSR